MSKRIVWLVFSAILLSINTSPSAQQPGKVYRVGMLISGSVASHGNRIESFRRGLRELGYIEGKNLIIEYRYAEGKRERFADLAADMVRLKPDVIFVGSTAFTQAARAATTTIPIVATAGDLVGDGIVSSLAQPGGNITGSTNISPDLSGKRLELLKQAVANASRIAMLYHPNKSDEDEVKQTELVARSLGVAIHPIQARVAEDFPGAFAAMRKVNAQALIIVQGSVNNSNIKLIAEHAIKNRLPSISEAPDYADGGCMMSYGPNLDDFWHRGALFVDKILKGAKPGDLPVEQPKKFDFVINLKTANQIGISIAPTVLARADRVIK